MPKQPKTDTSRREPLTRERALMAAVCLADSGGIGSVTMRGLARELGVEAMSLYYHVANKEDILDGMVDLVFAEIELPGENSEGVTSDWKQEMRERAESARRALVRHPWAVSLMDSRSSPGPATMRHHDAVLGCLRGAGFSVKMAAHAFSVLDSYVFGFVVSDTSLPFDTPGELEALAATIIEQFPAEQYPHFYELTVEHVLRPGYNYSDEFQFGLGLILDGLEGQL